MPQSVTRTDAANNLQKIAEGRLNSESFQNSSPSTSTFIRMIVMEVITDPNVDLVDQNKLNSWHAMGVSNMQYASSAPRNTIIAKKVGEEVDPMIVFPFFPSHLSLPCKPGECVWAMLEKPEIAESDMAFWFARVVEPHTSDDVNHSHPGRSFEPSLSPSTKDRLENDIKGSADTGENVFHELRNGPAVKKGGKRVTAGEAHILVGEEEDIFERLLVESKASEYISYEPIPRFRKRPGDIALEGTNNTLIVLGTDRSGSISKSKFENASGAIDVVVGRGQTEDTFGVDAATTSITKSRGQDKGGELKREINKSLEVVKPKEGDPDFKSDRSRILISQRTSVDDNFALKDYNKNVLDKATVFNKEKVEDSADGDAGIVIKSDKVRLIARSDIEIIVTNFDEKTAADKKTKVKEEKTDTNKWASIVIKKNGDVVVTPAKEGYIKLGGDDADLAVLCSKALPAQPGIVKGTPIVDTMGGTLGAEGALPTGQFATKVLIK